jgi:hypothetical protein
VRSSPGRAPRPGLGSTLRWGAPPALALALAWPSPGQQIADYELFARTGAALLRGHVGQVYADPTNQAGPLQLALVGAVHGLDAVRPGLGERLLPSLGAALVAVLLVAGARSLRSAARLAPAPLLGTAVAVLAALWGLCLGPLLAGHPAEVAAPALWLAAACVARGGRAARAGLLVAAAAACEPWGLLGLPVLLLVPTAAACCRAACVAGAGAAATYLPFLASGSFELPRLRWPVGDDSLVHAVLPQLVTFPWSLRMAQGGLALGVGTLVALALRRPVGGWFGAAARDPASLDAVWLVPLATSAARLVLDPVGSGYYWWTPLLLCLGGVALARRAAPGAALTAVALAWWSAVDPGRTPLGTALATLPVVVLAALAVARRNAVQLPAGPG